VSNVKPWSIPAEVDITGDNTTTVAAHDLHGNSGSSFQASANIAAVPGHTERNLRVYADGGEHRAAVLDTGLGGGQEHDEAGNTDDLEDHHEDAAFTHFVGVPACNDGEDAGADVGRDRHELGLVRGVAHVFDNLDSESVSG